MSITVIHTITVEFSQSNHEDAKALRDIVNELGYNATLTSRTLDTEHVATPMRDTRLGWVVLSIMSKRPRYFWTNDEVGEELEAYRYKPASAAVALTKLVDQGDVERMARGRYRIVRTVDKDEPPRLQAMIDRSVKKTQDLPDSVIALITDGFMSTTDENPYENGRWSDDLKVAASRILWKRGHEFKLLGKTLDEALSYQAENLKTVNGEGT